MKRRRGEGEGLGREFGGNRRGGGVQFSWA